jgi:hypothetical protein
VKLVFSAAEYPHIRPHFRGALRRGWPRTLVLNRRDDDARRNRALLTFRLAMAFDRDEYPPAVGRGRGPGLRRGRHPRGWKTDDCLGGATISCTTSDGGEVRFSAQSFAAYTDDQAGYFAERSTAQLVVGLTRNGAGACWIVDAYIRVSQVAGRTGPRFISPSLQLERIERGPSS